MRKFFAFLFVFLLIAAGAGYLLYPTISDQMGQAKGGAAMRAYREKTAAMSAERIEAMLAEAASYNEKLETVQASDPFSAGIPRTSRDYQSHLNVHSGIIGELVIPAIGVYLPVYHNSAETPATANLVHLESSSLPSDQPGTSIILAGPGLLKADGFLGEIGLTDGRMLQDLDRLGPGDLMILNVLDRTMVYRIGEGLEEKDAILMLTPGGIRDLDLTQGAEQQQEPEAEPETEAEPAWVKKLKRTPEPTGTPEPEKDAAQEPATEQAQETTQEPEPTPVPTPEPTPEPSPEPTQEPEQNRLPGSANEQLTLLTPWSDQKLLVVRSARIPISEAQELLDATDRATYPEGWQNILLLGSPVLLLGMIYLWIVERFKKRSYRLPIDWKDDWDRADDARSKADNDGGNASEDDDDEE